jgi:mono/diheme cytochrome c family protein
MKRIGSTILVVIFLTCCIGLAMAGDKGNARKGKYLYRKNCRTCHIDGGEAKALSPIDKEQAEWQKVFDNAKDLPCAEKWAALSEKDITDIYAHLWGHAKDSPSPAKCE